MKPTSYKSEETYDIMLVTLSLRCQVFQTYFFKNNTFHSYDTYDRISQKILFHLHM